LIDNAFKTIRILEGNKIPERLLEIPDPPSKLYIKGEIPKEGFFLAVVGSRRPSPYGRQAVEDLIAGLAGYPINIVSGLALGIDALSHRQALKSGLKTVAVPGSGLSDSVLYPSTNRSLAKEILEAGGALLSEFEPDFKATPWSFPQRNRIMAGLSDAVLLIEAEIQSGTLITARLASDYNRDVMVLPGSIYSSLSKGTNLFLKLGAVPITESADILRHFNLEEKKTLELDLTLLSEDELKIWQALSGALPKEELLEKSGLSSSSFNIAFSLLELKGYINESMGVVSRKV
jgi:DNA processing protein